MGGAPARAVFLCAVLASLSVLFAPASGVPSAPPGTDKVVHLLLFAVLATSGRWAGLRTAPLAQALTGYAVVSELVQGLAPLDRSMSVADAAADVLGIAVGLLAWRLAGRRARPSRGLSCVRGPGREA